MKPPFIRDFQTSDRRFKRTAIRAAGQLTGSTCWQVPRSRDFSKGKPVGTWWDCTIKMMEKNTRKTLFSVEMPRAKSNLYFFWGWGWSMNWRQRIPKSCDCDKAMSSGNEGLPANLAFETLGRWSNMLKAESGEPLNNRRFCEVDLKPLAPQAIEKRCLRWLPSNLIPHVFPCTDYHWLRYLVVWFGALESQDSLCEGERVIMGHPHNSKTPTPKKTPATLW